MRAANRGLDLLTVCDRDFGRKVSLHSNVSRVSVVMFHRTLGLDFVSLELSVWYFSPSDPDSHPVTRSS